MQVVMTKEMAKAFDAYCEEKGIALSLLMEAAGRALAKHADHYLQEKKQNTLALVVGPGMNGSDLYVAGRILSTKGYHIHLYEHESNASAKAGTLCHLMRSSLLALGVKSKMLQDFFAEEDFFIDGLLGTGFNAKRELAPDLAHALEQLLIAKEKDAFILSCDLPSGLDANEGTAHKLCVKANNTVTFVRPKLGIVNSPGQSYAGQVHTESLDLPHSLLENFLTDYYAQNPHAAHYYQVSNSDLAEAFPEANTSTHKWKEGNLLLFCGQEGMSGSSLLALSAAQKTGLGLLHAFAKKDVYQDLFPLLPQVIYKILAEEQEAYSDMDLFDSLVAKASAILLGPGLAPNEENSKVLHLLLESSKALVLDAGALRLLAQEKTLQEALLARAERGAETILTPHEGEAKALALAFSDYELSDAKWEQMSRLQKASFLQKKTRACLVFKGPATITIDSSGSNVYCNNSGGPGLAKAGSGDILAGLIAGLLAKGLPAEKSAYLGVYWHGAAGDLATSKHGTFAHDALHTVEALEQVFR